MHMDLKRLFACLHFAFSALRQRWSGKLNNKKTGYTAPFLRHDIAYV